MIASPSSSTATMNVFRNCPSGVIGRMSDEIVSCPAAVPTRGSVQADGGAAGGATITPASPGQIGLEYAGCGDPPLKPSGSGRLSATPGAGGPAGASTSSGAVV